MNLGVARIGKARPAFVGAPARGDIRTTSVGGEIVNVAVAARGQHDRVGVVPRDLAGLEISNDDALRLTVHDHQIQHLGVGVTLHRAAADHFVQCGIRSKQQLLTSLAARIKRAADLGAAEGPVVEQPAIFTGKRHALRRALVDDVD